MCFSLIYRNSSFSFVMSTFHMRFYCAYKSTSVNRDYSSPVAEHTAWKFLVFSKDYHWFLCISTLLIIPFFSLKIVFICLWFFMTVEFYTELEYYTLPALQIHLQSPFHFLMDSSQCLGTKSLSLLTSLWPFFFFF